MIHWLVGSPPRITDDETEVTFEEGGVATLRCEAEGDPVPTIYWKLGNKEVRLKAFLSLRNAHITCKW